MEKRLPDSAESEAVLSAPAASDRRERPDGFTLIAFGWAGIGFGLFLSFILVAQATTPGGRDYFDTPAGFLLSWISGNLIQFGLMLLLTGLVIRAIWLIPSRS